MTIVLDIGSYQTLIGLFDNSDNLVKKISLKTSIDYLKFLRQLEEIIVKDATLTEELSGGLSQGQAAKHASAVHFHVCVLVEPAPHQQTKQTKTAQLLFLRGVSAWSS